MKNIKQTFLLFSITLVLAHTTGTLNAMKFPDSNPNPLKRSRMVNFVPAPTKVDYNAALDAALLNVDEDGTTVLHAAASDGNLKMCRKLLARGANPLAQNREGNSPLHCAVLANYHEIAAQLIEGMPHEAMKERIFTVLCILQKNRIPKVLQLTLLSYLPELITGYSVLCKQLVPNYISRDQLYLANYLPKLQLQELKNRDGLTAYEIAKSNRNSFMARMTNPKNRALLCQEELDTLLIGKNSTELKENKE